MMPSQKVFNWARTHSCAPGEIQAPHNESALCDIVKRCVERTANVRFVGGLNSPNDIAMSNSVLVDMTRFAGLPVLDSCGVVHASGGTTVEALSRFLSERGKSLPVQGSISRVTVAGAIATATHGTGLHYGNLSSCVTGARIVNGLGEMVSIDAETLPAIGCHLGQLGGIVEVSLQTCDDFDLDLTETLVDVEQALYELGTGLQHDHYKLHYLPGLDKMLDWRATRRLPSRRGSFPRGATESPSRLVKHGYWAMLAACSLVPALLPRANAWYAKRAHPPRRTSHGHNLDVFTFDCLFRQHTAEWAVPMSAAPKAIMEIIDLARRMPRAVHVPIEIRFADGDEVWMSPCQGGPRCYIGIVAYRTFGLELDFHEFFEAFEDLMLSVEGRPHWAKTFSVKADRLRMMYPHWNSFQRLRHEWDPYGLFENTYSERVLGNRQDVNGQGKKFPD